MKLKLVVVDLQLSARQKCIGAAMAAVASLLGGASVAFASVPHSFVTGETLKAADLNDNFANLDTRITAESASLSDHEERLAALEGAPAPLVLAGYLVPPGATYHSECLNNTGSFAPGACARMATYYCQDEGYVSGWLDGDASPLVELAIVCIK